MIELIESKRSWPACRAAVAAAMMFVLAWTGGAWAEPGQLTKSAKDEATAETAESAKEAARRAELAKRVAALNERTLASASSATISAEAAPAEEQTRPRRSTRSSRASRSRDRGDRNATAGPSGGVNQAISDMRDEDSDVPPEERTYIISLENGTYSDLTKSFARQAGLPIIGENPPDTLTVSYVSAEEMDYRTALNEVRRMLFQSDPLTPFTIKRGQNYFEVGKVNEEERKLSLDRIFTSVGAFQAADLDDYELAMLLYTPPEGAAADLETVRLFMPDYVRIAPLPDVTKNAMRIFAAAIDIQKYLDIVEIITTGVGDDPRQLEIIPIKYVLPSDALNVLGELIEDIGPQDPAAATTRRRTVSRAGKTDDALATAEPPPPIIYANDAHNELVVRAMPSTIADIKKMLPIVDRPDPDPPTPVIIRLKHAQAEELAEFLKPMLGGDTSGQSATRAPRRKSRRATTPTQAGAETVEAAGIVLIPDPKQNALIVLATDEDVKLVRKLVEMFDLDHGETDNVERVELCCSDANMVSQVLNVAYREQTSGQPLQFNAQPDPSGTALILLGSPLYRERAKNLIAEIDIASDPVSLHRAKLENAVPSALVALLQNYDNALQSGAASSTPGAAKRPATTSRRQRRSATPTAGATEKFIPSDETQMLYVICSNVEWEETYKPLIQQIDAEAKLDDDAPVVIHLNHADPAQVVEILRQTFPPAAGRGKGAAEPALLFTTSSTGIIVVNAKPAELTQIRNLIEQELDVEPGEFAQRLFTLEHAPAAEVEKAIQQVILGDTTRRTSRRGKATTTTTGSEARVAVVGETIIVTGPVDVLDEVAKLIDELDVPKEEETFVTRIFDFPVGTDVSQVASTMEQIHAPRIKGSGRRSAAAEEGETPKFLPQIMSNQVLVHAPESAFPAIEATVAMLRHDPDNPTAEIRFFNVEHGDVSVMAELIQPLLQMRVAEMVNAGTLPTAGPPSRGAKAAAEGPQVTVTADATLGRLIVAAPAAVMDEAQSLITEFDQAYDCEQVIRTVSLDKAPAEEMKAIVEGMIKGEAAAAVSTGKEAPTPRGRSGRSRRTSRRSAPATTTVGDPTSPVNVYVAPGGGALVLAGCVEDVEQAQGWITMLDGAAMENEDRRVYYLVNSDTEDLAQIVLNLVDSQPPVEMPSANKSSDEEDPLGGFDDFFDFGPTGPQTHKGADLVIITEPITRTMIVQGSPSKLREVDRVIAIFEPTEDSDPLIKSQPPTPYEVYELEKRTDAYEAMFQLEDVLTKFWPYPEKPYIDYWEFPPSLIIKGKKEHFPEVIEMIKKFVDKASQQVYSRKTKSYLVKKGLPTNIAERLADDLESQGYVIEFVGDKRAEKAAELIKVLDPLAPLEERNLDDKKEDDKEKGGAAPCVLPMSLRTALGIGESVWMQASDEQGGQAPPADDDKDDKDELPTPEELMMRKLAEEAKEKSGEAEDSGEGETAEGEPSGEPKLEKRIVIDVSDIDKIVRVRGSQKAIEAFEKAKEELEEELEEIPDQLDIRVFQLKHIDVKTAEEILESMFGAAQRGAAAAQLANQQNRAQQIAAMRAMMAQQQQGRGGQQQQQGGDQQNQEQQQEQQAAQQEPINIRTYARPRDRQLIVRAKPEDFPVIIELLATIDRPAEVEVKFQIFPLAKLNATVVAEQLKELLGLNESGSSDSPRQPTAPQRAVRGQAVPQMPSPVAASSPGGESWAINPSDQIVIKADEANNSILAMAPKTGLAMIGDMIADLESQSGMDTETRTYRLEHADAAELVPELKQLLEGAIAPSDKTAGEGFNPIDVNEPKLMAVTRTNSIVVRALRSDFAKIEPLIQDLDSDLGDEGYKVEVIPVAGGNVTKIAQALNAIYVDSGQGGVRRPGASGASTSKVKIVGDDGSNTIIVYAPDALRKEIAGRIEEMLGTQDNIVKETIPLALAKPSQVATALKELLGGPRGQLGGDVAIAGDDNSKQLVVMAPRQSFEEIKTLAKKLDQPPSGLDVRIFPLKHAKAAEVAETIKTLATSYFQSRGRGAGVDPPSVTPDVATNSLIVMGDSLMFDRLGSLVKEIDVEGAAGPGVNLIMVEHVEAGGLAQSLNQMYQGRGSGRPGENPVSISNPQGTSALIVRADPKDLEDIEALVADLDRPERVGGDAIEAVQVRYSTATEMKDVLSEHLRQAGQAGGGRGGEKLRNDVRLGVSESTNTIMISGDREEVDRLVALTKRLDEAQEAGGQGTQIISVEHVKPSDIEPTLVKMYVENRKGGRRGGNDQTPSIVADDIAKVMIVRAGAMDLAGIESLIAKLDRADAPPREDIRVVKLDEGVDVFEMADIVQEAMMQSAAAAGNQELALSVQADDRTGSIILAGAADKFDRAEQLIRQLEEMGPAGGERTLIIDLKNIGSDEAKEIIEQMTEDADGGGSSSRRNTRSSGNRGNNNRQRFTPQRGEARGGRPR